MPRGTEIVLHLKEDAKRYLESYDIQRIVKTYSDHIQFPIELLDKDGKTKQINTASAIWQRPKSEVKARGLHGGLSRRSREPSTSRR